MGMLLLKSTPTYYVGQEEAGLRTQPMHGILEWSSGIFQDNYMTMIGE